MARCLNDGDHIWTPIGDGWARCVRCDDEMDEATLIVHGLMEASDG